MMKNSLFIIFSITIILISLYLAIDAYKIEGFQVGTTGITEICSVTDFSPSCISNINYIDTITKETKTVRAKIDSNYYIDLSNNNMLQKVPYGYVQGFDKTSYVPKSNSAIYETRKIAKDNADIDKKINDLQVGRKQFNANMFSSKEKEIEYLKKQKLSVVDIKDTSSSSYNSDNYDITYHPDPSTLVKNTDESSAGVGKMWIRNTSGNLIAVPYSNVKQTTLYYEPGSYPFGPSSYVPNYEESTLLSKSSNQSNVSSIYGLAVQKKGFCEETNSSVYEREQKCNQINTNACASTTCCVLLGGEKCVAGNGNGPSLKANYSDFLITNRDYYYYQGKCYGNCS